MNVLERILETLDLAASVAASVAPGGIGITSAFADKLLKIAIAANKAHIAATGQPIDLSKLHEV